jgi:hypothetical protein
VSRRGASPVAGLDEATFNRLVRRGADLLMAQYRAGGLKAVKLWKARKQLVLEFNVPEEELYSVVDLWCGTLFDKELAASTKAVVA